MELGSILEFLENKTILVTGATGYLAKIFVEKILRVQPNVKKFYLLLRASDAKSAMERLQEEVIGKELFKVLREKYGETLNSFLSEKITPIPGDISYEDLGIGDSYLRDALWEEIDLVVNFAATTNFDERYNVALGINTLGALNVLNFAKKCLKIKMIVHVSTAYVCGEDRGLILEKPFSMGKAKKGTNKIDIEEENKLVQEKLDQLLSQNASDKQITAAMKDFGLERARFYGWPNTYVFTKAMAEKLLVHLKENSPLLIIRPTMISSTYKEPFPGWIEGVRTIDSVIVGYAKGKVTCFISNPHSTLDVDDESGDEAGVNTKDVELVMSQALATRPMAIKALKDAAGDVVEAIIQLTQIPADMVVNGMIVAMVGKGKNSSEIVYQIGSSLRNPVKLSNIHDFSYRYFSANPWINMNGSPVHIRRATILSSMPSFHMYMTIRNLLPLKALQVANTVVLKKYEEMYRVLDRKINLVMRLVELYKPYVFFEGTFDDTNLEKLRITARETCPEDEADEFNFDPTEIDWEDYMMGVHIPGLVKYVMK